MPHTFFPHQQKAFNTIKDESRVALFMQMRMGKSPVAVRWARRALRQATPGTLQSNTGGRVLITGPLSVLDDWVDELKNEGIPASSIVRLDRLTRTVREEYIAGGTGWYLLNKEAIVAQTDLVLSVPWDVVIVDESTIIRNPQAKITKILCDQLQYVPYRAILSGEPAPEGPLDYFSQFKFLLGSFMDFNNYWVFRAKRFRQHVRLPWLWMPQPGVRDEIHRWVHTHAVVMTRQQWKIGGTYAPVQRRVIEMNDRQRRALKEITKKYSFEYIETNFATVRDVWLARVAGGFSPDRENPELLSSGKADELINLLKTELHDEPVVVWFRFNEELEYVVKRLNAAKISALGVTGATPKDRRKPIRDAFAAGKYQALCIQVQLGKFGWDLSHARTAIRYSNAYDLESYSQSRDRIVHPAKTDPLLEIHLVTKGTLDEDVYDLLKEKKRESHLFMRELNVRMLNRLKQEQQGETQTKKEIRAGRVTVKVRRIYPGQER